MQGSGGSRPSAKEGLVFKGLTMNVKFCENNSGTSKKMRYFQKNKVGAWGPWPFLWIRQSATARGTNIGSRIREFRETVGSRDQDSTANRP